MILEYRAEVAEEYWDSVPQPGEIVRHGGEEHIVVRVSICNNSKLEMKTVPKKDIKHYEDFNDISVGWDEFSESFLKEEPKEQFLEDGSLSYD